MSTIFFKDEEESEDDKTIAPIRNSHIKFRGKRGNDISDDLGSFSSFYKRHYFKRSAPALDDLDTFTSFIKRDPSNDDLGLFTTFYKKSDDLDSFSSFYKKNQRFRRQAEAATVDDLGAFTTFMKKRDSLRNKRSPLSREDLRNALGTFSSFMDPYQYYKRVKCHF